MRKRLSHLYISYCPKQLIQTRLGRSLIAFPLFSIGVISTPNAVTALTQFSVRPLLAQKINCQNSGTLTQLDLNKCAEFKRKSATEKLEKIYQQVRSKYKNDGNEKLLTETQLSWTKYRDSVCSFEYNRFSGGSIAPLIYSKCIDRITKQRTSELEGYLREGGF